MPGTLRQSWWPAALVAVAALAVTGPIEVGASPPTGLPDGPRWIVTMGDSAISGEAGRWAGNSDASPDRVDTGRDAYFDDATGTGEEIPGCHRSRAAEAHIGVVNSLNLACSGARTTTRTGDDFTPGLDWYDGPEGRSQVVELQDFADDHRVEAVVVLIGANDYGFADIVQRCVGNWLTSPWWWKNHCHDDRDIRDRFTSSAVDARTDDVAEALINVVTAMSTAGYEQSDYDIIVQTYWSPIPRGSDFRYSERGWSRQSVGGCGVWNRDADWANDTAVTAMNRTLTDAAVRAGLENHVVLDMSEALDGHRLCERGVDLVEDTVGSWTAPGAADASEWVSQIRTVTTIFGPYQLQEAVHANYWGQLAMRNCLRQAYNGGDVRGGTCTPAGGVNLLGEPNMALT